MYDDDFGSEMEAIEQERFDADVLQAEMNRRGNHLAALEKRGICTHSSAAGYRNPPIYPEQKGLKPGQLRCTKGTNGCKRVFDSDEDWHAEMEAL